MFDTYHRQINYLRISVTDRCNLRCIYCIPEEGVKLLSHTEILSFEEILEIVKIGVKQGITKVRLTGGEPLVRRNIVDLIKMISSVDEITDLSMTTNGTYLRQYAMSLKDAGLHRLNISLDTLDAQRYKEITRGGALEAVLDGINAAKENGFNPIKINCVIKNNSKEPNAIAVGNYCSENKLEVRYIHEMNLHEGTFSVVEGGEGGHCSTCNRLRLTANGILKPCLFNDIGYDVRKIGIENAFRLAVENKPKCGSINLKNEFNNIGG